MKGSRNSLSSLRVFLAAGRHLNFSRTAEELHLTQSAVSKHIQALEERLGTALFKRTPTGLRVTYAGALYLEKITAAVRLIDEADALVAHPNARVNLNIAVSPSFAQYCLIPNLQEFFEMHPEIRINVRPRLMLGRDKAERFDAEIQLHTGYASGMATQYLCGKRMALVASPALLARQPIRTVADLEGVTLLKRAQRGYSWDDWKTEAAPTWAGPSPSAPEYEGFSLLLPALLHGLGAAVVPLCLVGDALADGTLVRPLGESVDGRYGYHLMLPRPNQGGPYLDAFSAWVTGLGERLDATQLLPADDSVSHSTQE